METKIVIVVPDSEKEIDELVKRINVFRGVKDARIDFANILEGESILASQESLELLGQIATELYRHENPNDLNCPLHKLRCEVDEFLDVDSSSRPLGSGTFEPLKREETVQSKDATLLVYTDKEAEKEDVLGLKFALEGMKNVSRVVDPDNPVTRPFGITRKIK